MNRSRRPTPAGHQRCLGLLLLLSIVLWFSTDVAAAAGPGFWGLDDTLSDHHEVGLFGGYDAGYDAWGAVTRAACESGQMPDQIVVKVGHGRGSAHLNYLNHRYGTTTVARLSKMLSIWLLAVPEGTTVDEMVDELSADRWVEYAIPNGVVEPPQAAPKHEFVWASVLGQEDYDSQYALDQLGMYLDAGQTLHAHDFSTGSGVDVFLLDTGLFADHEHLSHAIPKLVKRLGYDFVDDDFDPSEEFPGIDNDGDGLVDEASGHGTFVAGTVHLIAPDAWLIPMRVLDPEGYGNEFVIAEAITLAVDRGADVINLSFVAGEDSALLADALEFAESRDVVVVSSAGNEPVAVANYPAASSCALGVTAVGADSSKSDWAGYGAWVDFVAPGEGIVSTFPDGEGTIEPGASYVYGSGTSISAPFVAGQMALLRSLAPELSARELSAVAAQTAVSVDAGNPEYAGLLGSGMPMIAGSLQFVAAGNEPDLSGGSPDPLGECR